MYRFPYSVVKNDREIICIEAPLEGNLNIHERGMSPLHVHNMSQLNT